MISVDEIQCKWTRFNHKKKNLNFLVVDKVTHIKIKKILLSSKWSNTMKTISQQNIKKWAYIASSPNLIKPLRLWVFWVHISSVNRRNTPKSRFKFLFGFQLHKFPFYIQLFQHLEKKTLLELSKTSCFSSFLDYLCRTMNQESREP